MVEYECTECGGRFSTWTGIDGNVICVKCGGKVELRPAAPDLIVYGRKMTKQEKIREALLGKIKSIHSWRYYPGIGPLSAEDDTDDILECLHSQGAVIKVDIDYGEMKKVIFGLRGDRDENKIYPVSVNSIECVAVEPLIEDPVEGK